MKAPGKWTIQGFFKGRPASRKLFNHVRTIIKSMGPVKIEAAKTQISFGTKTHFAFVWLPQMWNKKRPDDSVTLTFDLDRRVKAKEIAESVLSHPKRWTHHIVVTKKSDVSKNVRTWLKESYIYSQRKK